jgi:uncharacterized RDD family membrane protein YckC
MRCPKCRYISFGTATRCRNCGYDLSLSEEAPAFDLPIQSGNEPIGPMKDLPLSLAAPGNDRPPVPAAGREEPGAAARAAVSRFDLPLFADDAPLVSPGAVPRPPLSVRRGAPVLARPRQDPTPAPADDDEPEFVLDEPVAIAAPAASRPVIRPRRDAERVVDGQPDAAASVPAAPVFRRLLAGVIDVAILGAIDAAVVYFTLRVLGLQVEHLPLLPKIPLGAFLLLLNGGYFVLFTAACGQTIGKMTSGVRVVMHDGEGHGGRVGFGTAVVRAAAYLASLLPAGLGFAPIVFSPDGRTIHDRLADTRVVRA